MPDQPDDARKRPQRGVFPPFFAPRTNGRGESTPTPPSGSWRRVSRLFTPPEVARQRRTPAAQQAPYTPPPALEAAEEVLRASLEASEASVQPESEAFDAIAQPEAETRPEVEASDAISQAEADASWTMVPPGAPAEEELVSASLPDLPMEAPVDSALPLESEQAAADALGTYDPMAFDDRADSFVVESLETEPISLAPSDVERMEVDVAMDSSAYSAFDAAAADSSLDTPVEASLEAPVDASVDASVDAPLDARWGDAFDSSLDGAFDSPGDVEPTDVVGQRDSDFAPGAADEVVESIENYLAGDAALADDAVGFESALVSDGATLIEGEVPDDMLGDEAVADRDDRALVHDEALSVDYSAVVADDTVAAGSALDDRAEEIDPWAGAELPEPAFGSIGWPSSELAALPAEQPVAGVDEMSAALAWSDAESSTGEHESPSPEANGADVSSDDALSGMAHELRDSSSAWVTDTDVVDDADVSARARFYGGGERSTALPAEPETGADDAETGVDPDIAVDPDMAADPISMGDPAAAPDAGGDAAELARLAAAESRGAIPSATGDDAGAAIADALARVAARIRAGEVNLPTEAVGASDESALAAALAALLRGPRR